MSKFYPDTKRLFENLRGRKARYSPEDLAEEFKKYIADLEENQIEVETNYRYMTSNDERRQQRRSQKYARPPKILDFVTRWLGMTHQWWYSLPNGKRGADYEAVIERITQYCYDTKFDGAVVGLYNANIIARDLGLKENIAVSKHSADEHMSEEEIDAEIRRLEKLDKE
ncbi:DNA-packaging protein [Bacteroides xylanisolvens]|uniref:DNA-packaging protein n=1 Tax=Bacteroides xylanisolvens TaxID=371601 RepID=UPI001CDC521C|nr:DNA-packaging protein [Bacteroides xylanisolvens]MCA4468132.1 DNA-packaging protein [Bacteroides xylanisolvens]MCA4472574.1 DNA-packaging protein [Bacteroides xylanisolvens]MCA4481724.1 DNA-packaging protein [Bacteroides xylanisolvens]MCA4521549.1 DNA-packaging protein [Bacteroides xylanisolvens]MCA4558113.1 DNA-packaging protein [Bacteroides xylanisolvens]